MRIPFRLERFFYCTNVRSGFYTQTDRPATVREDQLQAPIVKPKIKRILGTLLAALITSVSLAACGSSDTSSTTGDTSDTSGARQFADLPTKTCPTSQGLTRPAVPLDDTTTMPVSSESLEGFAAFTNTSGTVLIGPDDWKCESTVAVNGGEQIALSPDGEDPFDDGAAEGITYYANPACQGCIADQICAVFPYAPAVVNYANMGVSCDKTKPLKEELTRIGEYAVLFEDPPGVKGTGQPSGGDVASTGMLTYSEERGATQVSCALPDDLASACPSIVTGSMLHDLIYVQPN